VSRIVPRATRIAWTQKRDEIMRATPGITRRRFIYIMKRSSYGREWGKRLQEPNALEEFLAILLRLIPPIGPLQVLQLKMPTPAVERLFMQASTARQRNMARHWTRRRRKPLFCRIIITTWAR
jgi:hypothetical protein